MVLVTIFLYSAAPNTFLLLYFREVYMLNSRNIIKHLLKHTNNNLMLVSIL